MFLPDVNIWTALAFQAHSHHPIAKKWFDGVVDSSIAFCRFTQQGFLRLATNSSVFGRRAVTLVRAWNLYDQFLQDSCISLVNEPEQLEMAWRRLTNRRARSPKLWNDAYLAAFARTAGLTVVTFDKAFNQFAGVAVIILP